MLVAFLEVASLASSNSVLPSGLTALAHRLYMVDSQLIIIASLTAVLALIEIPEIEILA